MADNNLTPKQEFLLNPVEEHTITDAAVASFETNLKHPVKVTIPLNPIQDLHGMPNPYPAGASVNLIPDGTDTENGYVAGYYLTADGGQTANADYYISEYFAVDENTTYTWSTRAATVTCVCFYNTDKQFISSLGGTSSIKNETFNPPTGAIYMRASQTTYNYQATHPTGNAVQIEEGSTATEYRRYSNICAIEGWTGINVYHDKDALFNTSQLVFTSGRYLDGNGAIKQSGSYRATVNYYPCSHLAGLKICTNIVTSTNSSTISSMAFYSGEDESLLVSCFQKKYATDTIMTFTVPETAKYLRCCLTSSNVPPVMAIVRGTTMPDPVPTFSTLPITWQTEAGTVYGGTLTINEDGSGTLVSEMAKAVLGNLTIAQFESNGTSSSGSFSLPKSAPSGTSSYVCPSIASFTMDQTSQYNGYYANRMQTYLNVQANITTCYGIDTNRIVVGTKNLQNVSQTDFIAYISDWEVAYKLSKPVTYELTASEVGQLLAQIGQNNIWSDAGNVTLKYLTQNSETGVEYRGDRALELRRRAMLADAPTIHTTVGSSATGGLASFRGYVKAPVKQIEIPFAPKQDLHGYDNPWPAGSGKNLLNPELVVSSLVGDGATFRNSGAYKTFYIPVSQNTDYIFTHLSGRNKGSYFGLCDAIPAAGVATYELITTTNQNNVVKNSGEHGYIFVCIETSETVDTEKLQVELGLTATDYAPYENICPIEGWTGMTVEQTGKNLFSGSLLQGYWAFANGNYAHTYSWVCTDKIACEPSTSYTVSADEKLTRYQGFVWYDANGTYISSNSISQNQNIGFTATSPSNAAYLILNIAGYPGTGDYIYPKDVTNLRINASSDLPITWQSTAGTVYGGTLTIHEDGSGMLKAEWANRTFNGSENWAKEASRFYYKTANPSLLAPSNDFRNIILCDKLKTVQHHGTMSDYTITGYTPSGIWIYIQLESTTSVAELKEWLSNNQCQVTFKIGTPITYNLTAEQVGQLLVYRGDNNFWCDISDDITVKYWNRG